MKKVLFYSLTLFALFLCSTAQAQFSPNGEFDVRFKLGEIQCDLNKIFIDIEVRAHAANTVFRMGSGNYRFSFNTAAVANPTKVQSLGFEGFTGIGSDGNQILYFPNHNMTGTINNIASYNTFYSFGMGDTVSTDWHGVGRISFDIIDATACLDLVWLFANQGAGQGTVMNEVGDFNNAQGRYDLFDADPMEGFHHKFCIPLYCRDFDNDGLIDIYDLDDDNDGIPDWEEVCGTTALDFSCLLNGADPSGDEDGDGIIDYQDSTFCNAGFNNQGNCELIDIDDDGNPNYLDIDADNDGISDLVEAHGGDVSKDTDGNGFVDCLQPNSPLLANDADNDGWCDDFDNEGGSPGTPIVIVDTDGDLQPDYQDIDADNDGIVDIIEWQATYGYVAPTNVDTDGDGMVDAYDVNAVGFPGTSVFRMQDVDQDNVPDYLDPDTDGDQIPDYIEGWDLDNNGLSGAEPMPTGFNGPYPMGADSDNDGLLDIYDGTVSEGVINTTNDNTIPLDFAYNDPIPGPTPGGPDMDWRNFNVFLPVDLLSFEGDLQGADAILSWVTVQELNNSHFVLERSFDGDTYEALGEVRAAEDGNAIGPNDYFFIDRAVVKRNLPIAYYRLVQFDLDGNQSRSDVVELLMGDRMGIHLHLYPNPASDQVSLQYTAPEGEELELRMVNLAGQEVLSRSLEASKGLNNYTLRFPGLSSGVYFLYLNSEDNSVTRKLLIE